MVKPTTSATVIFSQKAWIKMFGLVNKFTTEVQWQGFVKRLSPNSFYVEDIVIFPHEVSDVSVDSHQEEFEAWQDTFSDEDFDKLRLHGHSHVNMCVHPSAKDEDVKKRLLKGLGKPRPNYDPFFIFMIINKNGDIDCQIHDRTSQAVYTEVTVDVLLSDKTYLGAFIKEARDVTTDVSYQGCPGQVQFDLDGGGE